MTRTALESLLRPILRERDEPGRLATEEQWAATEARLGMRFPQTLRALLDLLVDHDIHGGELYGVHADHTGNDEIATVLEQELAGGGWPEDLVPFYGVGNGDYFALDRRRGGDSYSSTS